jgi:hypothetical protein
MTVIIRMTRMMMTMMTTRRRRWRQKGRRGRGIRKEYDKNDTADSFRPACYGAPVIISDCTPRNR